MVRHNVFHSLAHLVNRTEEVLDGQPSAKLPMHDDFFTREESLPHGVQNEVVTNMEIVREVKEVFGVLCDISNSLSFENSSRVSRNEASKNKT